MYKMVVPTFPCMVKGSPPSIKIPTTRSLIKSLLLFIIQSMDRENRTKPNRALVTYEPLAFEKSPVGVQDFGKITHHSIGIYEICLELLIKKYQKITTCNQLDLETLGNWLICMPKNLPGH